MAAKNRLTAKTVAHPSLSPLGRGRRTSHGSFADHVMSKPTKRKKPPQKPAAPPADDTAALAPDDRIIASNLTLHELFQKQTATMLDRADLDDEQKQDR